MSRGKELIEHAIMEMISDRDFDGYLAGRFDIQIVKNIGDPERTPQTAALTYNNGRFFILVVEDWFGKLTDVQRVAVIKHEIRHFVFKHISRRNGRDPVLFNISSDMIVNQELPNLPDDCVKLPEEWPAKEPSEVYYDKLLQEVKKNKQGQGTGQGQNQNQKGGKQNNSRSGKGNKQKQGNTGNNIPKQWDTVMDNPLQENDADSLTDDILRETIKERLNAGDSPEKLRGLHAGALESYIDDLTKPPMIDWKHALARFVASLSDEQTRLTLKRPDRRNLSPYGRRKEYLPAIIICVDTSGSVSDELLSEFFSQINFLGHILSEIDVVIADAAVQDHFVYRKGLEPTLKKKGYGRGGTDFDPAVQYINKELGDKDGAVYLTDGWCPVPNTKCKLPMIWVVTDNDEFEGTPRIMAKDESKKRGYWR